MEPARLPVALSCAGSVDASAIGWRPGARGIRRSARRDRSIRQRRRSSIQARPVPVDRFVGDMTGSPNLGYNLRRADMPASKSSKSSKSQKALRPSARGPFRWCRGSQALNSVMNSKLVRQATPAGRVESDNVGPEADSRNTHRRPLVAGVSACSRCPRSGACRHCCPFRGTAGAGRIDAISRHRRTSHHRCRLNRMGVRMGIAAGPALGCLVSELTS